MVPRAPLLATALFSCVAHASDVPVVPMDDGRAVRSVDEAQPFTLREGALTYDFRAGAPSVRSGHLVALHVAPTFLKLVQVKSPVLYAGAVPVQIVGSDVPTGCVVGVLPPDVDPHAEPFYYGSWQLPERVDAARGAAERRAATAAGLRPRPTDEITGWTTSTLTLADASALVATLRGWLATCTASSPPTR